MRTTLVVVVCGGVKATLDVPSVAITIESATVVNNTFTVVL